MVSVAENTEKIAKSITEVQEARQYQLGALCPGTSATTQTLSANGREVWSGAIKTDEKQDLVKYLPREKPYQNKEKVSIGCQLNSVEKKGLSL